MKRAEGISDNKTKPKNTGTSFMQEITEADYKNNEKYPVTFINPNFGHLDKESEADKKWEIDYANRQRMIKKKRRNRRSIAVGILTASIMLLFTISVIKEKNKRDILEVDKKEYLNQLYVQCNQGVKALDNIEFVEEGLGNYELFTDSLKAIINLDNEKSNMERIITGFSAFHLTMEQIYQNMTNGQEVYQYEAFDADNKLSEIEKQYLTNIRYDFMTLCDAIYTKGNFNNLKPEEIDHLFSYFIKKYQTNSDIRTFSGKYSGK